jgi:multiple sugar transport system substrate-binding protein
MRNRSRTLSALIGLVLLGVACTAGGGTTQQSSAPPTINPSVSHEPVTITMWSEWTSKRELKTFNQIFDGFQKQYPWITVKSVGGLTDDKILAAISGGNPPDAVLSFGLDNVAKFCISGAWSDLTPFIQQDNLDLSQFPDAVFKYTNYGNSQCAFPFLTDAYGLYYNKAMFAQAGLTDPPKTLSELTEYAKKLTVFNPDGSIKVAGLVPWMGYYETTPITYGIPSGAEWYDADGKSSIASDPKWVQLLQWQKDLVDFYGADKLAKFVAGQGDEFSTAQDFETGRIAMNVDGEWRVAFIQDEAPNLNYGTAPVPVLDDQADRYGAGSIGGTIIGIPRGSPHPAEAWLLIKYMATDTPTLVYMANNVKNVPTTVASLQSPDLQVPEQFQTFLDIFQNANSAYKGNTVVGAADQNLFTTFLEKWQSGKTTDLQGGLQGVAEQIDAQVAQGGG